jgi:hypothetical protein
MVDQPKSPTSRGKKRDKEPAEKPVSLAPLSFEEAVKGLVAVKPPKKAKPAASSS